MAETIFEQKQILEAVGTLIERKLSEFTTAITERLNAERETRKTVTARAITLEYTPEAMGSPHYTAFRKIADEKILAWYSTKKKNPDVVVAGKSIPKITKVLLRA